MTVAGDGLNDEALVAFRSRTVLVGSTLESEFADLRTLGSPSTCDVPP